MVLLSLAACGTEQAAGRQDSTGTVQGQGGDRREQIPEQSGENDDDAASETGLSMSDYYEDFHSGDEMHRLGICLEGVDELEGMSGTIQVEKAERTETDERMDSAMENKIVTREYKDVVYDTLLEAQKFDLYLPKEGEGPFPLIFFIHGGGWFSGDKTDGQESAWITLRDKGYAVASINYRLSGEAPHPAGIIDCKTALRYLKAHADEYHIDTQRIAVSGDSSGGHYALMVALTAGNPDFEDLTRGNPEQTSDVACAVVWYPATDLAETMRTVQDGEYTFCVYALEQMQEKGFDTYTSLPLLSAYLGHKHIRETEYYLRLVEDRQNAVLEKAEEYTPGLFPEIGEKNG